MNELEDIKTRLLKLEAAIQVRQDVDDSLRTILFQLLVTLQAGKILPMQALIAVLESSAAFGQAAFDKTPPQTLRPLIDALKQLADAQSKSAPPK